MAEVQQGENGRKTYPGGSPSRTYVILEEQRFDEDNAPYYVIAGTVEARNGHNAMRKAYRELKGGEEGDCTLIPLPESYWKPTKVSGKRKAEITVEVG